MNKVIVIGGGPSGMMAAIEASKTSEVVLIEKNEKLGKKLYITGKGRCNITSSKDISEFFDYIVSNPYFLYSSLYTYTNKDTMEYFNNHGVNLKVERGDRVFPKSDKSSDIIRALENNLKESNVEIQLKTRAVSFNIKDEKIESLNTDKGIIYGDKFILCTGGISYPQTGSSGEGHKIAEKIGHKVTKLTPSLVPLEVYEEYVKDLQGLSLKNVEFSLIDKKKVIYRENGEMLFTHFGLSGPIVIKGSSYIKDAKGLKGVINLKPALFEDELDKRIQRDFSGNLNKDFKNSLNELLPKKLIPVIIRLSEIDENKKVNSITKEERKKLVDSLTKLTFNIKGFRPIDEAIITRGGIDVDSIDPSTMKSKLIPNLYFAGEIIDVDALTGGFNLQIALSTGYLSGIKAGE
ncbi:MAG: NAD(P)/FAD-dependent oxidoreductase [Clostridiaceae bacterium]